MIIKSTMNAKINNINYILDKMNFILNDHQKFYTTN